MQSLITNFMHGAFPIAAEIAERVAPCQRADLVAIRSVGICVATIHRSKYSRLRSMGFVLQECRHTDAPHPIDPGGDYSDVTSQTRKLPRSTRSPRAIKQASTKFSTRGF
jgi:hypothetical protein